MQGNAVVSGQHSINRPQSSSHGLNWQQQLQQATNASQLPYGHLGSTGGANIPSGSLQGGSRQGAIYQDSSNQGGSLQGGSLQGVSHQGGSNQGGSMGSISSPSAAAAADSWSWLDAFEQKQQSENSSGEPLFSEKVFNMVSMYASDLSAHCMFASLVSTSRP